LSIKRTIAALNLPAVARLKQLKTNLARLEQLSRALPRKYVVVNIPAAQIEAIEGDRVHHAHAGVVGKPERATPELSRRFTSSTSTPCGTCRQPWSRKD
jgi:murein L,D-transpeptidase YcbB/YkuD